MQKTWMVVVLLCGGLVAAGCQPSGNMSSDSQNAAADSLLMSYAAAWENADAAALDGIVAPGFTRTENGGTAESLDSVKTVVGGGGMLHDLQIQVMDKVFQGDMAAASWQLSGMAGEETVHLTGASIFTLEGGKIASEKVFSDTAPIMKMMSMSSDSTHSM